MAKNKIKVGNISNVSGDVIIAGQNIYKGYTADEVSTLLSQITTAFQPRSFDGRSPYKGLEAFEEEDADIFFGREKLTEELVRRLKDARALFIVGPAGSGTSSLVRAGLIHALKQGAISDLHSERWLYGAMKPGREPIRELALVVSRMTGKQAAGEEWQARGVEDAAALAKVCEHALGDDRSRRAVLFVDQFHEVFTQVSRDAEREAFLSLLTHPATLENGRLIVLFAMRSDFVSYCAKYPHLNALLNENFVMVGAMQPAEMVSAIAQPALRVGLRIEPGLISQIIRDTEGEPGALPLMQFALKDLFDAQRAQEGPIALTLSDYLQRGGIHKSLERHADQSFARLSDSEQLLARSVFSGLIEIGSGTPDTRRTALFDELVPAETSPADVEVIVQKLADARLITTDEQAGRDTVTIAHEKLIEAWPWLKMLVSEDRSIIALQNKIADDALEWQQNERDPSYLYAGARLARARERLDARKLVLSGLSQDYISRATDRMQQELDAAREVAELRAQLAALQSRTSPDTPKRTQAARTVSYTKYALVIGNNLYDDSHFAPLKTPEEDVTALVELLQDPDVGGFAEVQALVNRSSFEIEATLADFCADRSRDELMLVYFSGHGILDDQGRLYLAAKNTLHDRPRGRAIQSQFITENMDASRCRRQILILDCCHSGAFQRGAKGAIGKKAVTEATFEGKGYGRVVLTATDATQYAWENDQLIGDVSNSVFTHFLIDGLKTGAADLDGDGWISIDELYDYVYQQIVSKTPRQTPGRWIYRQQGKFFIATNPSWA